MTDREKNLNALSAFRASAKKAKPTKQHRPGLWENMLGTVYARNPQGKVEYFDYDWADAIAFIGPVEDIRCARCPQSNNYGEEYRSVAA
jgi:hypothetical protein